MKKAIIILMCTIFGLTCSNKNNEVSENILVFDGLLGTWQLSEENQFERWVKNSDGTYTSRMYSINKNDTTVMEDVKIIQEDGVWSFITQVQGQNNGKAITFTSTILTDSMVQFENPAHDFPRMINYHLVANNTMQAFIAGNSDSIYFNFSRLITK